MPLGYMIALIIFAVVIIGFIIAALSIANRMKKSFKQITKLQENFQETTDYFEHEITYIQERVEDQTRRGNAISERLTHEMESFDHLASEAQQLQTNISYVSSKRGDIAQSLMNEGKTYAKEEFPKKWDMFKEVSKRTVDKQKERYSK